jgi:ssDNA thymidine ADP-ribosyltransferase, DarT
MINARLVRKRKSKVDEDIKQKVKERGIKRLVHITSTNNLENIFKHGLLPRTTLSEKGIMYYYFDKKRLDNCLDALCLSIQRPNYGYLTTCILNSKPGIDWVILVIRREILWKKDCAFCIENAASNNVKRTPVYLRKGINGFNKLFEDFPSRFTRKQLGLKRFETTHPQAEVLVFDRIPSQYIRGVIFENEFTKNKNLHLIPENVKIYVRKDFFEPRRDNDYWKKVKGE